MEAFIIVFFTSEKFWYTFWFRYTHSKGLGAALTVAGNPLKKVDTIAD